MKVNKKQLEALIKESVEEQISNLNEEELDELLGGLKSLAQGAGAGLKRAGQAVASGASKVGSAIAGAAQDVGTGIAGTATKAAGAVKGAYQAGERSSLIQNLNKSIANTVALADKAIQSAGGDNNLINALDQVKQVVAHAGEQMKTEKLVEATKHPKRPAQVQKAWRRKRK